MNERESGKKREGLCLCARARARARVCLHLCIIVHSPCNTVRHTTISYNALQHTAKHCNTLQHTSTRTEQRPMLDALHVFEVLINPRTHCKKLQHSAIHCNKLQYPATHCNTLCDCLYTQTLVLCNHMCMCMCMCVCAVFILRSCRS